VTGSRWLGAAVVGLGLMGAGGAVPPGPVDACVSPDYYQFPMVPTGRVAGTGNAEGTAQVWFPHTPFGVAVTADGSYHYEFELQFARLRLPGDGTFVVWVTTTDLDRIEPVGPLTEPSGFKGQVGWNKFLVVVTHEADFDPEAEMWAGPVVIRGMSRSGMMHTMAGHGPFEQEKCSSFGY
jgi:hypothetical protein